MYFLPNPLLTTYYRGVWLRCFPPILSPPKNLAIVVCPLVRHGEFAQIADYVRPQKSLNPNLVHAKR